MPPPKRGRRNAIAVKQPVEDRRRPDIVAGDARIVQTRVRPRRHNGGEPTNQGSGRSRATQAMPGTISASAIVSQPFSSAKVKASASAASAPVANIALASMTAATRALLAPDHANSVAAP